MLALEWIAERRITEAVSQGEFDALPGAGKKRALLNARIEARYFRKVVRRLGGAR